MDPKRQARLIKTIAINMIVSLIFIGVGVFYVLPNYTEIETKKEELKKVHESLGTLSVA